MTSLMARLVPLPAFVLVAGCTIELVDRQGGSLTSRAPVDFTLDGFDGTSWVAVDRRSGERNGLGVERREHTVASPRGFEAYRLQVFDDNDERDGLVVASIGRLELLGYR
jgi:hypothetical protein